MAKKKVDNYFGEREERAVVTFLQSTDQDERNKVFATILYPAFTKMIESIIRGGNYAGGKRTLHVPDETFKENFDDVYSLLVDKMATFDPTRGFKAYSYTQTIIKNYLILKRNKYNKKAKMFMPYDEALSSNDLENSDKYATDNTESVNLQTEIIKQNIESIKRIINGETRLTNNEVKVGHALLKLLEGWEDLFQKTGSDKFNKNATLLFIKETTLLGTKEIRDAMVRYKNLYKNIKEDLVDGKK